VGVYVVDLFDFVAEEESEGCLLVRLIVKFYCCCRREGVFMHINCCRREELAKQVDRLAQMLHSTV